MCFRFLVRRGAQVAYHDALEYQQCHVAHRLEGLERVSVAQVEKLQPVLQLGAEMLAVARHQERARRAAVAREILLLRSGRATVDGDCEDARLGRRLAPVRRQSQRGAFGQRLRGACSTTWAPDDGRSRSRPENARMGGTARRCIPLRPGAGATAGARRRWATRAPSR